MDKYTAILSIASFFIPIITGAVKGGIDKKLIPLYVFFFVALLIELLQYILNHRGIQGYHLMHVFTLIEFCAFAWTIRNLVDNPQRKKIVLILLWAFILYWITAKIFIEDFLQFDSISTGIECFVLVICAVLLLRETVGKDVEVPVSNQKRFWIGAGVITYFTGVSLLFATGNFLINYLPANQASTIFIINDLLTFVANGLFAIAFICRR